MEALCGGGAARACLAEHAADLLSACIDVVWPLELERESVLGVGVAELRDRAVRGKRDEVLEEWQRGGARDARREGEEQAARRRLPHVAAAALALTLDVCDADHAVGAPRQLVVQQLLRRGYALSVQEHAPKAIGGQELVEVSSIKDMFILTPRCCFYVPIITDPAID